MENVTEIDITSENQRKREDLNNWYEKTMSRRKALKNAFKGVVVAAGLMAGEKIVNTYKPPSPSRKISTPTQLISSEDQPQVHIAPEDNIKFKSISTKDFISNIFPESISVEKNTIQKINEFLSKPLNSPTRIQYEAEFLHFVQNSNLNSGEKLKLIDQGLWATTNSEVRAYLLDQRYLLRTEEQTFLQPLDKELLDYAIDNQIHPEILAISADSRKIAEFLINTLRDKAGSNFLKEFRPDLLYKQTLNEIPRDYNFQSIDFLIHAVGMSTLVCTETQYTPDPPMIQKLIHSFQGRDKKLNLNYLFPNFKYGLCNIGKAPAIQQLKGSYEKEGWRIENISKHLSEVTGLTFNPNHLPGSIAGKGDDSGGAMYLQFMPDKIMSLVNLFKDKFDLTLNPFDVTQSVTSAYIFMAMGEDLGYNNVKNQPNFRFGFLNGSWIIERNGKKIDLFAAIREAAIRKWNDHDEQVEKILGSIQKFGGKEQVIAKR